MLSPKYLLPGSAAFLLAAFLLPSVAHAEDCTPPRILFVVDASSSMLAAIGDTTKWDAAQDAVATVLGTYPDSAQYGLMVFPGAAGQCATGEVKVDVAASTGSAIVAALANQSIPGNNQTPAGQSLMAASKYALITDPTYDNYVIFVTDGHQYCSVNSGANCVTASDCQAMGVSPCPTCKPDQPDGCYCVQGWPVLGAQALAGAGAKTYVVGFGEAVNFKALNQTAEAGGTALPNCDPDATVPSCYFQATMPAELTAAFAAIVQELVTESCFGACGIPGERTCTANGWSTCDAPDEVECVSSCDTPGTQKCVNDVLTECSSEAACGGNGGGGAGGAGGVGGGGVIGGTGGAAASGGTGPGGSGAGAKKGISSPEEDSGCGCRTASFGAPSGGQLGGWLLTFGLGVAAVRRRRTR
jgi:MYXO-CTERM domain-containing protein